MDPSELRYLEDEDTSTMKTIKCATTGFVAGTIWGTVVATWYDVLRVETTVALPGLIRTVKLMANMVCLLLQLEEFYIGVEQLVQNYRMKRGFISGAIGGFSAGATVLGYKGEKLHLLFFYWLGILFLIRFYGEICIKYGAEGNYINFW